MFVNRWKIDRPVLQLWRFCPPGHVTENYEYVLSIVNAHILHDITTNNTFTF